MPVLHVEKKGNFTQVTNAILRDPKMSLKAKGLLTLMLSMDGDRWTWSVAGLASLSRDGVDSVREGLKELHRLGYFFSRKYISISGKQCSREYIQEQLEAFNPMVMEYLLGSMDKVSGPVRNVKKYMTACILNAPNTWQYDADVRARHVLYDLPL